MKTVVRLEKVSKSYARAIPPRKFQERLAHVWKKRESPPPLEALSDLSFTIGEGERIALFGLNGAGKTTLLKLLSRVITQTSGTLELPRKVAPLLEAATGFHADLTGRENIFLFGGLIGLRRRELLPLIEQIAAFAEVTPFLESAIKKYSTGMVARLAISIALFTSPSLIIIDEALSTTDSFFQKKVLARMAELEQSCGMSAIFASHHPSLLLSSCTRGFYLERGKLLLKGDVKSCYEAYLSGEKREKGQLFFSLTLHSQGNEEERAFFQAGEVIVATIRAKKRLQSALLLHLFILPQRFCIASTVLPFAPGGDDKGEYLSQFWFDAAFLHGGEYCLIASFPSHRGVEAESFFVIQRNGEEKTTLVGMDLKGKWQT